MSPPASDRGATHPIAAVDTQSTGSLNSKWRQIALLSAAELFAMTLWFSATAVAPQLAAEWHLVTWQRSGITISIQLGFVVGTLLSAVLNLPDRVSSQRLFGLSALAAAAANAVIPLTAGFYPAIALRFLTGVTLAGVYPPGMKLVATWCKHDRGLGIGILVGALTIGTAGPHLLAGLSLFGENGLPAWRLVLIATSLQAVFAGLLILLFFRPGPYLSAPAPFNWRFASKLLSERPTRLANLGYLGHMWELFAMWTWVPLLLIESYQSVGWSAQVARISAFTTIAIGAIGCVLAGKLADRLGRTSVIIASLLISGVCSLIVGHLFALPGVLTAVCLVWGLSVVADSAQFSTAVSELADARYVGTALTVQTSLGFLLTIMTIHIIPELAENFGWTYALSLLALGPAAGILSMFRLRQLPESTRMAQGKR